METRTEPYPPGTRCLLIYGNPSALGYNTPYSQADEVVVLEHSWVDQHKNSGLVQQIDGSKGGGDEIYVWGWPVSHMIPIDQDPDKGNELEKDKPLNLNKKLELMS